MPFDLAAMSSLAIFGACSNVNNICLSIRRRIKANANIEGLVKGAVALLKIIDDLARRSSALMEAVAMDSVDFCAAAGSKKGFETSWVSRTGSGKS